MQSLSLAVVGADFSNRRGPTRRFEIALCAPGERVHLVPEPKNPVDPQAIQIVSERDVVMGYVTAERAPLINSRLARGMDVRAVFQAATAWGALVRVSFDGTEPVLPTVTVAEQHADDDAPPEWRDP